MAVCHLPEGCHKGPNAGLICLEFEPKILGIRANFARDDNVTVLCGLKLDVVVLV